VQNLVPAEMRSQAAALLLFFANIANLVVAPQLVGVVSDALAPRFGAESLRLALLPLTLCGFWAAVHFWVVARRSHNSTLTPDSTNTAGAEAAAGPALKLFRLRHSMKSRTACPTRCELRR
jgi:hypothetical protein